MKRSLLLLALFACLNTRAQITITAASMPALNDTLRYSTSTVDITSMLNDTGANRTWNFSNLVPDFQEIASFKAASSINLAYIVSFSQSTYGTETSDISLAGQFGTGTEAYNFYKRTSNGYVCDGRGFVLNGLPLSQTYSPKDIIYKFPLTYGNIDSNIYVSSKVDVVLASLVSTGKRVSTVDGWGTITTPYGTFNCLRVKSTIQGADTIKITTPFPLSLPLPRNSTEYKWLTNTAAGKLPILEVTVGTTTTVKYRDINRPEVFRPLARFSANKTKFAVNSTDTCILTDQSAHNPKAVSWTISPNTYSFVGGTDMHSPAAKLFFSATGTYTVTLNVAYNAGSDDTTIVNYITVQEGPVAKFSSSVIGNTNNSTIVNFYDSSTGSPAPTQWKWTFSPNTVSYVGATSSTSQNPKVTFDQPGQYTVSLMVTNSVGNNTVTKSNYLAVFNTAVKEMSHDQRAMSLYPNPAGAYFMIPITKADASQVEVYDITGKSMPVSVKWEDQACRVNSSQLKAGIYFVNIRLVNGQSVTRKLTVQ